MENSILGLAHVGFTVTDIQVSKQFYCDVLGFDLTYEYALAKESGDVKLAFLSCGDCAIELVEPPNSQPRTAGPVDHLSLRVRDIDTVKAALDARGVQFETETIHHVTDLFPNGSRWIFFRGPDGERLEINEIL